MSRSLRPSRLPLPVADAEGIGRLLRKLDAVRALSLQGAEVAPPATLDEAFVAPFAWTAQGLAWRFDVRFAVDAPKNVVAVDGATLTVTIN